MGKRRQFTSEFKVKIVLEMLREERTVSTIASEHQINPNQLLRWKKEFLDKAPGIFDESVVERERLKEEKAAEEERNQLLKKVGQLTMERDFLQAVQAKQKENGRFL